MLDIVKGSDEPEELRVAAAETLGWYNRSSVRAAIKDDLNDYLETSNCAERLRKEITKTVKRLSD